MFEAMLVSRTISLVLDTCVYPHAARSNLLRVDFRCRCSICQDLLGRKGERETQPFRLSYHASSHIVSAATVSDSSVRSLVSAPTISGPQGLDGSSESTNSKVCQQLRAPVASIGTCLRSTSPRVNLEWRSCLGRAISGCGTPVYA